ncbi:probable G-protein coupled receptor CG31760 [Diadema antillarum]|uniref:probable G-protein coupled receptor CG31760 n=1 Tax=Diadema antillarum TaxID=105358 RepID=UPI003A8B7CBB
MMTYTVPFLGRMPNGTYYFKGTSGLDIDLRSIDINQCLDDSHKTNRSKEENIFAGTDKCDRESQECEFIEGLGFCRGSYKCVCKKGYYFPDLNAEHHYYNGTEMEEQYDLFISSKSKRYEKLICLPCGEGCEECVDGRSCIFTYNWPLRTTFLVIQCLTIVGMIPLFVFTIQFRDIKVVKAASPVLLRIILIGALFLYCLALVGYGLPTATRCTLMQWFKEVGFSTLYGALLLKTWRISVVFRVRSAARVRITDMDLIKRLGLIIAVSLFYLIVRTVMSPPSVEMGKSPQGLKAEQCSYDWWDYAANIAELLLLLWGIRLCYVVRKAPSEFNESRFISWAIYNETLLSLFLCVATFFLQDLANPDVLYLIWFFYSQLTTTVVIVLLFGSKVYLVLHGKGDKTDTRMKTGTTSTGMRQRTWDATNSLSSQGLMVKQEEKPLNQVDIQEELKRLYTQLEMLKTRNMVVGNPHLTRKLTAMAEAARATEQMLLDSNDYELSCASNGVAEVTYTVNNGRTCNASSKGDWI